MPAEFGGGGGGNKWVPEYPGDITFQIADVKPTETTDYNDKTQTVRQFQWTVDAWNPHKNAWERKTIWTKRRISPPDVTDKQFISQLNYLIRACGRQVPVTGAEAEQWDENSLIGCRFQRRVEADAMTGQLTWKWLPPAGQPQQAPYQPGPTSQAAHQPTSYQQPAPQQAYSQPAPPQAPYQQPAPQPAPYQAPPQNGYSQPAPAPYQAPPQAPYPQAPQQVPPQHGYPQQAPYQAPPAEAARFRPPAAAPSAAPADPWASTGAAGDPFAAE